MGLMVARRARTKMKPAALFFDLDNTLIDDDASVLRSIELAYATTRHELPITAQEFITELKRRSDTYWESTQPKAMSLRESRLRFWGETLIAFGCTDGAIHEAAVDAYARVRVEGTPRLYEDTLEVLDSLHRQQPLAVITNGAAEMQREKLIAAGLWHYFDLVVAIDDSGVSKPEAAIFQHALEKLSLTEPAEVWHIGDSLANDVTGAHNAGLRSVWLNRNGLARAEYYPVPHHEITSLRELRALLGL